MIQLGNYRLVEELAVGEVATTYLAEHRVMPRRACVKWMNEHAALLGSHVAVEVLREGCMLSALQHAGIPTVFESGVHDARPWFASDARIAWRIHHTA